VTISSGDALLAATATTTANKCAALAMTIITKHGAALAASTVGISRLRAYLLCSKSFLAKAALGALGKLSPA
jgi:hypothetical protein